MVGFTPLFWLGAAALVHSATATLDPIIIKGSKFFYKTNGTQFYIRGIAYQSGVSADGQTSSSDGYVDPLADEAICKRDIPYLQALNTNVIRTYAIDPTLNHDACMQLLDTAGIYVITDLSEPNLSINRESPAWDTQLYQRYTSVVDVMAGYSNTLGFFAGNEVTNNVNYTAASAYVKAAVRDTKAYIAQKGYRPLGVGYAADDDQYVRLNVANYFNCGPSAADNIDFWGYNIYSWCGQSSFTQSQYNDRVAEFSNYSVPVFLAEYGCNTVGGAAGRTFDEVDSIFGPDMDGVFSGGIVFEYFEEVNDYGLVSVSGNSVSTIADYNSYSSHIATASPSIVTAAAYTPTNSAFQTCPTVDANWVVLSPNLPPTPNQAVCSCMLSSLSCVANSGLASTKISTLFSQVCGYNGGKPCAGISGNTTTGVYGAYSMCNATEKLSYAFNTYYLEEGSNANACNFGGAAQVVKAAAAASCSSLIASATANSPGSPTGSGATGSATKKSAAGQVTVGASLGLGMVGWVGLVGLGLVSGAGMIWL